MVTPACSDYLKKERQNLLYFEAVSMLSYIETDVPGSSETNGRMWFILFNPLDISLIYACK